MNMYSAVRLAAAAGVVVVASTSAQATLYGWNYVQGQPGVTPGPSSMPGGTVASINSTFDSVTKRLTFDVFFRGSTASPNSNITSGFWLVLNDGPNPKTHAGELAILYFDAATLSAPKLSVYGYNGLNNNSSWQDGAADQSGNQTPDLIKGIYETSYINSILAESTTIAGLNYRHMKFDIDASDLVSHTPLYPEDGPWHGTGFDDQLGIWFHALDSFNASYESSGGGRRGKITSLSTSGETYFDGSNITTFIIPTPSSAALLGLGGLVALRRRRA
ncbi:MAG TPA: MYXO-CTERM sorting domain-containing protein [Phycisphaerales bacterium]|nr:MYXO-CTERM sorting domain-containing protein [Phycisphaerales bacterium]